MHLATIASIFVLLGLAAQGAGLYLGFDSIGVPLVVLGSELGILGLVGVVNHARPNPRD